MIPADKSRLYTGTFRYGDMVYGRLAREKIILEISKFITG